MNEATIPPAASQTILENSEEAFFTYGKWRESFLKTILRGASIVGFFVLISSIINIAPVLAATYITAYILLLIVTFVPLPYWLRAGVFLSVIFGLGTSGLLEAGIYGDSRLFLLGFAIMAEMLFGRRALIIAAILAYAAIITVGILLNTGYHHLYSTEVTIGSLPSWIVYSLSLALITAIIIIAWRQLQRDFMRAQDASAKSLSELRQERVLLDGHIQERTADLAEANRRSERRAAYFENITQIARTITSAHDVNTLFEQLVTLVSDSFGFYHAAIFMLDAKHEFSILQAASSEGGKRLLENGFRLPVDETSIVGQAATLGKARVVVKAGEDSGFFDNPNLPNSRSEMALPLSSGWETIGVLDIQSTETEAFNREDLTVFSTLADQIVTAIQNVRLFQESQRLLSESQRAVGGQLRETWQALQAASARVGYRVTGGSVKVLEQAVQNPQIRQAVSKGEIVKFSGNKGKTANLTVPVRLHGEVIGVMDIRLPDEYDWTQDDVDIVQAVTERLSLAIETATLLEDSQRRAAREHTVADITSKISSFTQRDTILRTAVDELGRIYGDSEITLQLGVEKNDHE